MVTAGTSTKYATDNTIAQESIPLNISCNFSIVTTLVYYPISKTKVSGTYGYYKNNGNNGTKELLIAYINNNMVQYDTFWIGAIFVFRIYQLGMISRVGIFVTRYQYIKTREMKL